MAKKIRFPLEMDDGVGVRNLEELRNHFSLEKILLYLSNGKLVTWLRDRYLDGIADALSELDQDDAELPKKICGIFDVEYDEKSETNMEQVVERNRRIKLLKECGANEEIFKVVDAVAFEQDDLYDLLDEGKSKLYLCGERFSIPLSKNDVTYIGVNRPVVVIDSKELVDFKDIGIELENVVFDEKYQKLLDENQPVPITSGDVRTSINVDGYTRSSYLNYMLSEEDKKAAEQYYRMAAEVLSDINYDLDDDINELRAMVEQSRIIGMGEEFINTL